MEKLLKKNKPKQAENKPKKKKEKRYSNKKYTNAFPTGPFVSRRGFTWSAEEFKKAAAESERLAEEAAAAEVAAERKATKAVVAAAGVRAGSVAGREVERGGAEVGDVGAKGVVDDDDDDDDDDGVANNYNDDDREDEGDEARQFESEVFSDVGATIESTGDSEGDHRHSGDHDAACRNGATEDGAANERALSQAPGDGDGDGDRNSGGSAILNSLDVDRGGTRLASVSSYCSEDDDGL